MKQKTVLLILLVSILMGCQKETTETAAVAKFTEKTFVPVDEAMAKEKVSAFLSHLDKGAVTSRTTFDDTEVNEGRWLMEGSANYLKNANLPDAEITHSQSYSLTVGNTTVNGELRMLGGDMTSAFGGLVTDMADEEVQTNTLAVLVDISVVTATSTVTELMARVLYARPPAMPSGAITWGQAAGQVSVGTITELIPVGQGCTEWIPETYVYQWSSATPFPQIRCIQNNGTCLRTVFSQSGVNYYETWIPDDIDAAITIGDEYVDGLNQPVGGAYPSVPWSLKGVVVGYDINQELPPNPNTEQYLFVSTIIAAGYSYCY